MSDVPNIPDDKPAGPEDKKESGAVNDNGAEGADAAGPEAASPAANDNPVNNDPVEEPAVVETVVTETSGGDQPAADNADGSVSPTVTGSTTQIVTKTTTKKTITRTTTRTPAKRTPRKAAPKTPRKSKKTADAATAENGDAKPVEAAAIPAQVAANDATPVKPLAAPEPVAVEPTPDAPEDAGADIPVVLVPVPVLIPVAETPAEVPAAEKPADETAIAEPPVAEPPASEKNVAAPAETPANVPAETPVEVVGPSAEKATEAPAEIPAPEPAVTTPAETQPEPVAETETVAADMPVADAPADGKPADEEKTAGPAEQASAPVETQIPAGPEAGPENNKADTPWVDDPSAPVTPLADNIAAEMPAPKRGLLSRVFNAETGRHVISFATGMATTMAISGLTRTAVFSAATAVGLSSAPALIGAAAAAGFVLGNYRFIKQRHDAVKAGSPVHEKGSRDFWKQYRNTVLTSTILATAGGAFAHYCMPSVVHFVSGKGSWAMDKIHEGLGHIFNGHAAPDHGTMVPPAGPIAIIPPEHVPVVPDHAVPDHAPVDTHVDTHVEPAPVPETHVEPQVDVKPDPIEPHIEVKPEPVVPVTPEVVVPVEPTAADRLLEFKNTHHLSRSMQKLFDRALNGNAQAEKDIAYFLFNGFKGMPKDQDLAVTLFKHAASLGNVQAQVDDSYIQYWGLAHQAAHPAESLGKMQELAHVDHRAARLSDAWKAAGRHARHHVAKHAAGALRPH